MQFIDIIVDKQLSFQRLPFTNLWMKKKKKTWAKQKSRRRVEEGYKEND